jgi:ABC-type uncharacterized transport system substrate-binding protein
MSRPLIRTLLLVAAILVIASPLAAAPVPSKSADTQTLAERQAALESVREVVAIDGVSEALADQGFTKEEIDSRLAQLSDEELRSLAQNLEQVQAAGLTRDQWMWIGVGALAVLLLIVLL